MFNTRSRQRKERRTENIKSFIGPVTVSFLNLPDLLNMVSTHELSMKSMKLSGPASEFSMVWDRFFPCDLESILSNSPDGSLLLKPVTSKKQPLFSLCDNPVTFDNGKEYATSKTCNSNGKKEPWRRRYVMSLNVLPEGCIANVLAFTGPRDACRLSIVSSLFKSAEESDAVWERFLPRDYQSIIFASDSYVLLSSLSSKKELYLRLCEKPIIIDDGKKSFSLVRKSGKKCYMLSARDLMIVWGDTPTYWRWNSDSSSRFGEVAELIGVCWLEIRGKINATMLSPATLYAAYLVFKPKEGAYGLDYQPVEVGVGLVGSENGKRNMYLDSQRGRAHRYHLVRRRTGLHNRSRIVGMQEPVAASENNGQHPKERGDGWLEIELGEFFCKEGEDGELEMSVQEVKSGDWKGGLTVEGIEIRPKEGRDSLNAFACS
ncbi:hypothetical protein NC651_017356 [Populus alba x Populus x berolinensis]|nr:hypothetical protein NC651_017356 [Populus alba x Populus x berolinensis]